MGKMHNNTEWSEKLSQTAISMGIYSPPIFHPPFFPGWKGDWREGIIKTSSPSLPSLFCFAFSWLLILTLFLLSTIFWCHSLLLHDTIPANERSQSEQEDTVNFCSQSDLAKLHYRWGHMKKCCPHLSTANPGDWMRLTVFLQCAVKAASLPHQRAGNIVG